MDGFIKLEIRTAKRHAEAWTPRRIWSWDLFGTWNLELRASDAYPAQAPIKEAEKNRPTDIHSEGIAQFVSNPGVMLGVNRDIVSNN